MPLEYRFPSRSLDYSLRTSIEGVPYLLRIQWNWRAADWRVTISEVESGDVLVTSRRISPGGILARLPNGVLRATGPDPYRQEDLGDLLRVLYISNSEIESARASSDGDPSPSLVY